MSRRTTASPPRLWLAMALVMGILASLSPAYATLPSTSNDPMDVIICAEASMLDGVREQVAALGGSITMDLSIINGFSATIPGELLNSIVSIPGVQSLTPDASLTLHARNKKDGSAAPPMSELTTQVLDVDRLWRRGITGEGVGVALIDSGVTPVGGLGAVGKVLNGPDLSFDGPFENVRYLDVYGHGTHLAGIIGGHDPNLPDRPKEKDTRTEFAGIAPDSHIVSVKVADGLGAADVSQVIAGIQWVIDRKDDPETNIRVLTLAFGTDGVQDYQLDPLAYAVEQAWHAGIVGMVAAGNDGNEHALRNPATDPYVISVGATDPHGTSRVRDDSVLGFSNCGVGDRTVDLVAPGESVSSLRVAGSFIDTNFPEAADGDRFFRGTGTSQAAAVTSGVVALMLGHRPDLSPDDVKALLTSTADRVWSASGSCKGVRAIDPDQAVLRRVPRNAGQDWPVADGSGSLEEARGSYYIYHDGEPLTGRSA
jgi:serine protease AprX